MTTSMVCGVTGQTGAYLARRLLERGHRVVGTSRDDSAANLWRLQALGVRDEIELISLPVQEPAAIRSSLSKLDPDHIYYLAGPSSVSASFREPLTTTSNIITPVLTFLEVLRETESGATFFNAASTDCFGNQPGIILNEESQLRPESPYAIAKTASLWLVKNYRESYGLRASNGLLTNHESPLRGDSFVTQKIIRGLRRVSTGEQSRLELGNIDATRDWLWADDVALALMLIAEKDTGDDYVVGSGESHSIGEFLQSACERMGLDAKRAVRQNQSLFRPSDISSVTLSPEKLASTTGWRPKYSFVDLVDALVEGDLG